MAAMKHIFQGASVRRLLATTGMRCIRSFLRPNPANRDENEADEPVFVHILSVSCGDEGAFVVFRLQDAVKAHESLLALQTDVADELVRGHAFRLHVVNGRLEGRRLDEGYASDGPMNSRVRPRLRG